MTMTTQAEASVDVLIALLRASSQQLAYRNPTANEYVQAVLNGEHPRFPDVGLLIGAEVFDAHSNENLVSAYLNAGNDRGHASFFVDYDNAAVGLAVDIIRVRDGRESASAAATRFLSAVENAYATRQLGLQDDWMSHIPLPY